MTLNIFNKVHKTGTITLLRLPDPFKSPQLCALKKIIKTNLCCLNILGPVGFYWSMIVSIELHARRKLTSLSSGTKVNSSMNANEIMCQDNVLFLHNSIVCYSNCYEFICTEVLLHVENTICLSSFNTSGSQW